MDFLLLSQHLLYHLIPLCHRVPGHLGPLGDGTIIRLVGVNFHILPDLPLLLGEFLRRWDLAQPVQDCLPLGVQLLDEYLQLLLALFTGMGVDAFGVLGAVRPGWRVATLEEVVVDLCNAPVPGFRVRLMTGWKSVSGFCAASEESSATSLPRPRSILAAASLSMSLVMWV